MKFTPSTSVSSSASSTTTATFSENFYTSKGNVFGCFSGVISRILCSKSLPTHPSDHIKEGHSIKSSKQQELLKIEKLVDGSSTPNVVARLMGLDSMPEIDTKTSQQASNSITSTSSIDFREETEEMQGKGKQNQRMKTSFSFKETADYFELEDDDFFVLGFENRGHSKKRGSKLGNYEVGVKGQKQRVRREKGVRKQRRNREEQGKDRVVFSNEERLSLKISAQTSNNNVDLRNQSYHLSPLKDKPSCRKEERDGTKARKKKKKEKCLVESKEEEEIECCDLENSSPVSVLDHSEFINDPEVTTSAEEEVKLGGSNPFVSEDLQSDQSSGSSRETDGNEERINVQKRRKYNRKHENIENFSRICRLAEGEISSNSNWKYRGMLRTEDLEDVGAELGQQIFDQLVSELVDQLQLSGFLNFV